MIDIARIITMAAGCEQALQDSVEEIERLRGELAALDGRTCTGREYWRDKDDAGKAPKLYILHSIDQACPMHGTPEEGKRLRVYVGTDRDRIRDAKAAMEREDVRKRLAFELSQVEGGLRSCGYYLQQFYGQLGCRVEDDGQPVRRGDTRSSPGR